LEAYLAGTANMSMYQKLAADLNHDKMIDSEDLEILENFVNGNNTGVDFSWVTLDPDFEMPLNLSTDIGDYPTSKTVEINNRNAVGVDLMIFQMGDLTDKTSLEDLLDTRKVELRDFEDFTFKGISPNPFSLATQFAFINNKTQNVKLEIYALNGSIVHSVNRIFEQGEQTLTIDNEMIRANGVYLFQLTTEEFSHQGKLIKVK
jgi:hypothetical protein